MRIENSFEVPISVEEAWGLFVDVERIVPCMPGAELTEVVDEQSYRGKANVRLGPVRLSFNGDAHFEEMDAEHHRIRILMKGRESGGRGTAEALITSTLASRNGGTRVAIVTDLKLSGPITQFGRQGVVADVSSQLVGQFADCLRAQLGEDRSEARRAISRAGEVKGLSVGLKAVWSAMVQALRRFARRRGNE